MKKEYSSLRYFSIAFILTFFLVRLFLVYSPFSNVNVGPYNIHHLFPASLLLVLILLITFFRSTSKISLILAGISSSLILDEIIYLIATDGSDISYLSTISWIGALSLHALAFITIFIINKKPSFQIKHNSKNIISLIFLQFLLDMLFVYIYPNVSPIRATLIGLSALIIITIPFIRRFLAMNSLVAFLPIYSSALFGALLVQSNIIQSKSPASGIAHILILIITYLLIIFIFPQSSNQKKNLKNE
ncbi:MAG: hypothetical protein Q7R87_01995 [Nanoarchaeota archaeon]|nr:hypothetical protein [Nanoarchaeota archaeon]